MIFQPVSAIFVLPAMLVLLFPGDLAGLAAVAA